MASPRRCRHTPQEDRAPHRGHRRRPHRRNSHGVPAPCRNTPPSICSRVRSGLVYSRIVLRTGWFLRQAIFCSIGVYVIQIERVDARAISELLPPFSQRCRWRRKWRRRLEADGAIVCWSRRDRMLRTSGRANSLGESPLPWATQVRVDRVDGNGGWPKRGGRKGA